MKSFFQFTIVTLLSIAPAISAFAPPGRIINRVNDVASASAHNKYAPVTVKISMVMGRDKVAKSKEDDLELTRAIIMQHIASDDNTVVDDNNDDSSQTDSEDGEGKLEKIKSNVKRGQKKIQSVGSKIKNKLKNKLEKEG